MYQGFYVWPKNLKKLVVSPSDPGDLLLARSLSALEHSYEDNSESHNNYVIIIKHNYITLIVKQQINQTNMIKEFSKIIIILSFMSRILEISIIFYNIL